MGVSIHTIPLGVGNVYVLKDKGVIMVDGGGPNKGNAFLKGLEKAKINPAEIQLIILTHGHWDHIGSMLKSKNCPAQKLFYIEMKNTVLKRLYNPCRLG